MQIRWVKTPMIEGGGPRQTGANTMPVGRRTSGHIDPADPTKQYIYRTMVRSLGSQSFLEPPADLRIGSGYGGQGAISGNSIRVLPPFAADERSRMFNHLTSQFKTNSLQARAEHGDCLPAYRAWMADKLTWNMFCESTHLEFAVIVLRRMKLPISENSYLHLPSQQRTLSRQRATWPRCP